VTISSWATVNRGTEISLDLIKKNFTCVLKMNGSYGFGTT